MMRLKLDENLPKSLAEELRALGYDTLTVYDEALQGRSDREVWQAVVQEQRFLITQDVEFGDLRRYPLGSHAGVMIFWLLLPLFSAEKRQKTAYEISDSPPEGCCTKISIIELLRQSQERQAKHFVKGIEVDEIGLGCHLVVYQVSR